MAGLETFLAKMAFNDKQRLRVYRKISVMTRYGLPLNRVLDMLHDQATRGGKNPSAPIGTVMDSWRIAIRNGRPLSVAAAPWVPFGERMMIEAGEESQNLSMALDNLIDINLGTAKMRGAIIGGLTYPLILLLAVCGVLWLFGSQVIPAFSTVLPTEEWQGTAAQMAYMSDWVQRWLLPTVLAFAAFIGVIVWSLPRFTGPIRKQLDRFAPYSIYRLVSGAGFLMSLGALIAAGVQTARALEKMRRSASPWLKERLDAALKHVYSGSNMGRALQRAGYGYPDPDIVDDLVAYSDLPAFTEMLDQIGKEWLENSINLIQAQARVLNTVALAMLGGIIAWVFSGMFAIQQQITNSVQSGGGGF